MNEKESLIIWENFLTLYNIPTNINDILNYKNNNSYNNEPLFESIKSNNLENLVFNWYFESIKKYFKNTLSGEFWKFFNNVDLNDISTINKSNQELKIINYQFSLSINLLYKVFSYFKSNLLIFYKYLLNNSDSNNILNNNNNNSNYKNNKFNSKILIQKLQDLLITNLCYSNKKSKYFNTILFMFFERDFISFTKSFYNSKKRNINNLKSSRNSNDDSFQEDDNNNNNSNNNINEEEEEQEELEEQPSYVMEISFEDSITDINVKEDSFMDLCKKLHELNFIVISEEIFTQILFKKIFEHIEKRCKGIFEKKFLDSILNWADQVIFKWLGMILLSSSSPSLNQEKNDSIILNNSNIINTSVNQSFKDIDDSKLDISNNNNNYNNNSNSDDDNDNNNHNQDNNEEDYNSKIFNQWKTRLEFSIYENFSQQRISELFDMIVQYPDSIPSLEDLSICFQKIPSVIEKQLINNLKRVLLQRLLHPGANTQDIITQYISTIHSMNIIDPSGYVIEQVGKPIREYLNQREDTIRCIVSSFTDEENYPEIYEEFCNYDPDNNGNGNGIDSDSIIGNYDINLDEIDIFIDYKKWNPLSIDGNIQNQNQNQKQQSSSSSSSSSNNKKDIITHLVNIYEGTELFINEYRSMLSDRLLSINEFDLDKEIKNIELLKLRFGESNLYNCEIMIKDMSDSKRLNTQIKNVLNNNNNNNKNNNNNINDNVEFDTLILSELFWPTLKGEEFKYPFQIETKMKQFEKEYERIKTPRQLIWKQHLGLVDLDIELSNGQIQSYQVSPIHASLILLFQNESQTWSLDQLSVELKVSKDFIKKKLIYWVNNQLIKEVSFEKYQFNNLLQKVEDKENNKKDNDIDDDDSSSDEDEENNNIIQVEEEEEEKSTSAKEKEEQMRVVESFIIGMLINFKALPLERIHSMLTMFNSEQYTSTIQELKLFLSKLQNEEKIELIGNDYKIKK